MSCRIISHLLPQIQRSSVQDENSTLNELVDSFQFVEGNFIEVSLQHQKWKADLLRRLLHWLKTLCKIISIKPAQYFYEDRKYITGKNRDFAGRFIWYGQSVALWFPDNKMRKEHFTTEKTVNPSLSRTRFLPFGLCPLLTYLMKSEFHSHLPCITSDFKQLYKRRKIWKKVLAEGDLANKSLETWWWEA